MRKNETCASSVLRRRERRWEWASLLASPNPKFNGRRSRSFNHSFRRRARFRCSRRFISSAGKDGAIASHRAMVIAARAGRATEVLPSRKHKLRVPTGKVAGAIRRSWAGRTESAAIAHHGNHAIPATPTLIAILRISRQS